MRTRTHGDDGDRSLVEISGDTVARIQGPARSVRHTGEMDTTLDEHPADRYRRLAATFTATVQAVPPDSWGNDSPCDGWTAADVLRHVVDSERGLLGRTGIDVPDGPSVDGDRVGAWTHTRDLVQAVLDDPVRTGTEYEAFGRTTTVGATFATFMSVDLVVHRWDIARAAGVDEVIPSADLALARAFAEQMGDLARTSGAFGPALPEPAGADDQTRLLALLGRSAG